jgi:putative glutamine amidotransferase
MINGRPVIGITGGLDGGDPDLPDYAKKLVLNNSYIASVAMAGGIPLAMPTTDDADMRDGLLALADGVIISGGGDINPLFYGEEPRALQGSFDSERDRFDIDVTREAFRLGKPIFGICRGIQAVNVVFGGTLYQDTAYVEGAYIRHYQDSPRRMAGHTAEFSGGVLGELFGKTVQVNSFHHQSVARLAEGFEITAVAKDGVVEGIEKTDGGFVLGVQWHPELMASSGDEQMLSLFRRFVGQCAGRR